MFSITVEEDIAPAFADGVTIDRPDLRRQDETVALTLPAVATHGNGTTTYTLSHASMTSGWRTGRRVLGRDLQRC